MTKWISAVLLAAGAAFAAASGCGNPQIVMSQCSGDSLCADASAGSAGTGTAGTGGFHVGDGGPQCPHSCADLNADCGFVRDPACGVNVDCTSTCPVGQYCGGGGASRCGDGSGLDGGPDGGSSCTPSTCAELNAVCGHPNDPKCPGQTVDCSGVMTCSNGTFCQAGKCTAGDGGTCVPLTACDTDHPCGMQSDGCTGTVACAGCNGTDECVPDTSKVSGTKCVATQCMPTTTCATVIPNQSYTYTCGKWPDNCGNPTVDCGPTDCGGKPGWSCGGGGMDGVCGCATQANGMPGTCSKIPDCAAGKTTTIKGKVYDPAGNNPLYNVLVYIPNDPSDPALKNFPAQISCDVCGASAAGSPLPLTGPSCTTPGNCFTGVDGTFQIDNVPVGTNIPLVIELGRWRRVFTITVGTSCGVNTITDKTLLMPSTQAQGNIPLMAMMTGNSDSLECVLRKMGIASTEFTNPAQGGRVQFYLGGGASGQTIDANTPGQATLFANAASLNKYDMAILACQGGAYAETAAQQTLLRNYADKGGRVFLTHYSYTWATQSNPGSAQNNAATPAAAVGTADNWAYGDGVRPSDIADWHIDENDRPGSAVGIIDKSLNSAGQPVNPKATAFQGWLEAVGASTVGSGQITVNVIRHDTDLASALVGMDGSSQTQQWLYRNGTNNKTCAIGGGTCTSNANCTNRCAIDTGTVCTTNADCPVKHCSVRTGTTCTTDGDCAPMVCQNRTQQTCTQNSDCTGQRGPCVPNTCSTTNNACTANACNGFNYAGTHIPLHFTFNTPVNLTPDLTVNPPKVQCGRVLFSDFHVQDANENGVTYPNQCGAACTSNTQCSAVTAGSVCAADGHCLDPMTPQEKLLEFMIFDLGSCVPTTKCNPKACPAGQCGVAPDGCGGLATCDPCPTGTTCGVPTAGQCGKITCTPLTSCTGQGPGNTTPQCGFISDGCTGTISCGMCPTGQVCNNGQCQSGSCTPATTCPANIVCGSASDNCGGKVDCGTCPVGQTCSNGQCSACVPKTSCATQMLSCGQTADNCGNPLDCGTCAQGQFCSAAGKCVPLN